MDTISPARTNVFRPCTTSDARHENSCAAYRYMHSEFRCICYVLHRSPKPVCSASGTPSLPATNIVKSNKDSAILARFYYKAKCRLRSSPIGVVHEDSPGGVSHRATPLTSFLPCMTVSVLVSLSRSFGFIWVLFLVLMLFLGVRNTFEAVQG